MLGGCVKSQDVQHFSSAHYRIVARTAPACQELYSVFYRKEQRWHAEAAPVVSTGKTPSGGR